ncbi:hypothetical protein AVEN_86543-1 [Araneus ventricosus]|uniref:Uncharacterized protein n=1 Tax=Araneus ventricosus TaxID=182803 RepID=A0A4Y2G127_ARAVE|nr:hypothetical protein AVEN_86543-1 [Araneus ventricosus]
MDSIGSWAKKINNNKEEIDLVKGLPSFAVGNREEAIFSVGKRSSTLADVCGMINETIEKGSVRVRILTSYFTQGNKDPDIFFEAKGRPISSEELIVRGLVKMKKRLWFSDSVPSNY